MRREPDIHIDLIQGETFHLEVELLDDDGNVDPIDANATTRVEVSTGNVPAGNFTISLDIASGTIEVLSNQTASWPAGDFFVDVRLLQADVPEEANFVVVRAQVSMRKSL